MTPSRPRRSRAALTALAAAALLPALPAAGAAAATPAESRWLLSAAPGHLAEVRTAARAAGARVVRAYPDLDVLAVLSDRTSVTRLLRDPHVLGARADSVVSVTADDAGAFDRPAPTSNVYREAIRSSDLAARGVTGAGVTVAVVDTGISPVPQLADRLVQVEGLDGRPAGCVNFTSEATCDDQYGHGTFLGGLIAGSGPEFPGASAARLLSVKLAGASGASDTSTLLAALQWVVAHREEYGVRVLNLSLGTPAGTSWRVDPLNLAVERAVDAGITVVVSAGNTGPDPQSVLKPGDDPLVLTVGASDDRGTVMRGDDSVPLFSAQGPTRTDLLLKPDVVAPGSRLISLRAPGSTVEQNVPGGVDTVHRRGSGTSMSAAVVSGAVAQLLQAHPTWTPLQVKSVLMRTADPMGGLPPTVVGRGLVDVLAAASRGGTPGEVVAERSAGNGGLAAGRGGVVLLEGERTPLVGEHAANGRDFDSAAYRARGWTRADWANGIFASTNWQSTNWQSTNWQSTNWQSTNWQSTNWQSTNWQSTNWQSTNWQGSTADPTAYYGRPGHGSAVLGAWE